MNFRESLLNDLDKKYILMINGATDDPLPDVAINNYQEFVDKNNKYHARLESERLAFNKAIKEIKARRDKRLRDEENAQNEKRRKNAYHKYVRAKIFKTLTFLMPIIACVIAFFDYHIIGAFAPSMMYRKAVEQYGELFADLLYQPQSTWNAVFWVVATIVWSVISIRLLAGLYRDETFFYANQITSKNHKEYEENKKIRRSFLVKAILIFLVIVFIGAAFLANYISESLSIVEEFNSTVEIIPEDIEAVDYEESYQYKQDDYFYGYSIGELYDMYNSFSFWEMLFVEDEEKFLSYIPGYNRYCVDGAVNAMLNAKSREELENAAYEFLTLSDEQLALIDENDRKEYASISEAIKIDDDIERIYYSVIDNYDDYDDTKARYNSLEEKYKALVYNDGLLRKIPEVYSQAEKLEFDSYSSGYEIDDVDEDIVGLLVIPKTYKGKKVVRINPSALRNQYSMTSVVIPGSIDEIGSDSFKGCSALKSATIGEGVKKIGQSAFASCKALSSVEIPDSVQSIEKEAFYYCAALTNITIPRSVTTIGKSAFAGCEGLVNIDILGNIEEISNGTFSWCYGVRRLTLPNTSCIKGGHLGWLFTDSKSWGYGINDYVPETLEEVIIRSGTTVETTMFAKCSKIRTIILPKGLRSIEDYAFNGCTSLKNITIPEGVTTIGMSAFMDCSGLSNIVIPEGVTSIGDSAFIRCTGLSNIVIPEGITSIGVSIFNGCAGLLSVTIPSSITNISDSAFSGCTSLLNVTISEGVTTIGVSSFEGCTGISQIEIPKSVTSIGSKAFNKCSNLLNVTIPYNVKKIGENSFANCSRLENVFIDNGITAIPEYAFYNCVSLDNIIIPASVTTISSYAFSDCTGMTSLVISASVTEISRYAFYRCAGLVDVYYTGSEDKWSEINIGWDNTYLTNATKHYSYVVEDEV